MVDLGKVDTKQMQSTLLVIETYCPHLHDCTSEEIPQLGANLICRLMQFGPVILQPVRLQQLIRFNKDDLSCQLKAESLEFE